MAILSNNLRTKLQVSFIRYTSKYLLQLDNLSKTDILNAVNATDQWIDDNQASFNTALPVTFRTNATIGQKTLLFCMVALMRLSENDLKRFFGDID